ncbi:hypothetical protein [Actinomadura sp. 6N118]|uniref:hypothetical protein n=1 Tax=Actinomadura sp. 6N118 TaxID=3375151 RepID=UPI0037AF4ED2
MDDRAQRHVAQLAEALDVLGIEWKPDPVPGAEAAAVMWAHALLGAAEAHLIGAEIEAGKQGLTSSRSGRRSGQCAMRWWRPPRRSIQARYC